MAHQNQPGEIMSVILTEDILVIRDSNELFLFPWGVKKHTNELIDFYTLTCMFVSIV